MNKKELIDKIAAKAGVKKVEAEKMLSAFEESVIESLQGGDKVTMVGFGTFSVTNRKARKGRNPQTGGEITIAARKSPKFVAGKNFKEAVTK
ncbi:MAG: HU family DNA-binding protein [Deferribacteraceae bacterium]|nr:HU family DNA-binding protein [Deferribacteraceae bacterium]